MSNEIEATYLIDKVLYFSWNRFLQESVKSKNFQQIIQSNCHGHELKITTETEKWLIVVLLVHVRGWKGVRRT